MRGLTSAALLAGACAVRLAAQAPAFEVASIMHNTPGDSSPPAAPSTSLSSRGSKTGAGVGRLARTRKCLLH